VRLSETLGSSFWASCLSCESGLSVVDLVLDGWLWLLNCLAG